MGTTTNGFPYPDDTDPVTEGAQAIEDLATLLDTRMYNAGSGSVTYATNAATALAGTQALKRGGAVHLVLNFALSAAFASGVTIMTVAAGYRPVALTRGFILDTTSGVLTMVTITTAGLVYSEGPTLTSGHTFVGAISYAI